MTHFLSPSSPGVNGQGVEADGRSPDVRQALIQLSEALGVPISLPELPSADSRPVSHNRGLELAARGTSADLSTSRVRVGFTRGHLLEVVVQIPLDVRADEEDLQVAAEIYLEATVGTARLDMWVASVSVDRIARTSGLVMVADSTSTQSEHPLSQAQELIERGVAGVTEGLPAALLDRGAGRADQWTALEIPPCDVGIQSDRRYASTCTPEALKCALEGMPFSSARFTRGGEVFCWVAWEGGGTSVSRLARRTRAEEIVAEFSDEAILTGTGFGSRTDYLDVWLDLTSGRAHELLRSLRAELGPLRFSVYDSELSDVVLSL